MTAIVDTALLLDRSLTLSLGERTIPAPREGQALLRLEWAGVCGSDLHVLRTGDWVTQWPATLGHEIVGVVEACPAGEFAVGTRVVVDSRMPCGDCEGCRRGPHLCSELRWVGEGMPGGFQRHAVFGVAQLVACPDDLESALAVLAEPLAVAMHAVMRAGQLPDRTLILGYGPVGALVHAELSRQRPRMAACVVEPHPARAQMAAAAGAEVFSSLADLSEGKGARWPLVVDASGYDGSLADAMEVAAHGATIVLVGLAHASVSVAPQVITERALSIVGSNGFLDELPAAIALLHQRPAAYRWLITDSLMLDEAPQRLLDILQAPTAGKVVIAL